MHHDASLNIRQLQVFEAVARLESYSRAQQELGISVSAISNAMSQLEGQLGFTLCQRGRGGFSLTEKGQQFLQQAIRVLSELNELERQSALLKGEHSGTLCISTLDSIETETALSLPVVLRSFSDNFPHVHIKLIIRTPAELMADSAEYLDIYTLGLPFLFLYNVATGIFTALGDSRTPFLFLAGSSTANIAADVLFVAAFDLGVAGVAWATFLCQGVSCVLSLWVVARRVRGVPSEGERVWFSWKMLGQIAVVAIPSILQQSFVSVGNIIIQSVVNSFGASVIAGFAAATKLNNVLISSLTTLGSGISNYASQNLGAGKKERVKAGLGAGVRLLGSICLCFTALYLLAGRQLLMLFMNSPTGEAINTGLTFLQTIAPFYLLLAFKLTSDGLMRGCGMMGRFMATTLSDLFLRVVLAMLFSRWLGVNGIWLSWPVGWFVGTVLSMVFYRTSIYRQAEEKTTL